MSCRTFPSLPSMLLKAIATLRRNGDGTLADSGFEACYEIGSIDSDHIARYQDIIGNPRSHLPLTYFYLPAQRVQIALMLDRRFPYPIPGLIHTANEMRFNGLPKLDAPLVANVSVRPHGEGRSGPRFIFKVDLMQFGDTVISCASEYQVRRKERAKSVRSGEVPERPMSSPVTTLEIPVAAIRRYAMVSGDFNPIHLSSLMARTFGYRSVICHGMYCAGLAAASIERQTGRQVTAITSRFMRPIHVPGCVGIDLEPGLDEGAYFVLSGPERSIHISGEWSLA